MAGLGAVGAGGGARGRTGRGDRRAAQHRRGRRALGAGGRRPPLRRVLQRRHPLPRLPGRVPAADPRRWPGSSTGRRCWANIALLATSQLVIELLITAVLWRTWGRRAGIAFLVLGTPMIFFPFPYVRIDLLAVLLAVGGAALGRRRHPVAGGAVLALAVFAKVWPARARPGDARAPPVAGPARLGRHRPDRPGRLGGVGRHVGARPGGHLPRGERLADRELPRGRHPHDRPGLVTGRAGGVAHGRRGAGLGEGR